MSNVAWGSVIGAFSIGGFALFCEYNSMPSEGLWVVFVLYVLLGNFRQINDSNS